MLSYLSARHGSFGVTSTGIGWFMIAPIHHQALSYDRQTLMLPSDSVMLSDRNLACAVLIRHETLSDKIEVKVCVDP